MAIEKDKVFELAERYVNFTGRSVFLTGKAGTGKTTFLKYISESTLKRFVILAPTGVAAINAGGSTIHSFFQLPLCPYLPDVPDLITEYQMPDKYRSLKKERQKNIAIENGLKGILRLQIIDTYDKCVANDRKISITRKDAICDVYRSYVALCDSQADVDDTVKQIYEELVHMPIL